MSATLIFDEDGLYDRDPLHQRPAVLLGLKGTNDRAELHFIHPGPPRPAAERSNARRGELQMPLRWGLSTTPPATWSSNHGYAVFETAIGTVPLFSRTGSRERPCISSTSRRAACSRCGWPHLWPRTGELA